VAGERSRPIRRSERRAVDRAVREAEQRTGLQFCVYLGLASGDAREHAESLFVEAGLQERPAVLLLVAPDSRRVEVVTAPAVRDRLPDDACAQAIEAMTPLFALGRYVGGLEVGIRRLADAAGPGTALAGTTDLPNVLD
jgi:uncharacterized membrane protein YgcG